MPFALYCVH